MFITVILSIVVIATVMLGLAIGVMFRGRCLRGTCGGEGVIGPNGEILTCDTCPRRKEIEEQLRREHEEEAIASTESLEEPTMSSR